MKSIVDNFIKKHDKTNLHALLCLKSLYVNDGRAFNVPFQLREMSRIWKEISLINPAFLDSDYAPVFFSKQVFVTKIENNYFISENYREGFLQIEWADLILKIEQINPIFLGTYESLLQDRENFFNRTVLLLSGEIIKNNVDNKLIPALLEIFSYAILKIKLNFYGADIYRWTKTNANDGGVDMTCGDVSYCVTTNLNLSKINKDAKKQVRDKLNFITIIHNLKAKQIQDVSEKHSLTVNIINLSDLIHIHSNFSAAQKELFLKLLQTEIEKELDQK